MCPAGAGHGEDVPIQKFVAGFLPAFPGQIVLRGKEGLGVCAHAEVSAECSIPYVSMAEPLASGQNPGGDERERNRPNEARHASDYAALIGATSSLIRLEFSREQRTVVGFEVESRGRLASA